MVRHKQNPIGYRAVEIAVKDDPKRVARSVSQFEGKPSGQRLDSSFEAFGCSVARLKRLQT